MKPNKIYANDLEQNVLDQFYSALEQDYAVKGALMADAHLGYSLPIGGVIATKDVIVPAWIGFDVGCGIFAVRLANVKKQDIDKYKDDIFKHIYAEIPTGLGKYKKIPHYSLIEENCPMSDTLKTIFKERNGLRQLGTLGGGNHFIEIGYDSKCEVWVIIHSGSRGIGHAVATHYMKLASDSNKAKEGHFGLRTDSDAGREYIMDMEFCLQFATESRNDMFLSISLMIDKFTDLNSLNYLTETELGRNGNYTNNNHNHAEFKDDLWIHRKGAVQADKGMLGVIPGNMRDGSFVVKGKGNLDSLNSSSHGAGRAGSRKWARQNLSMATFKKSMATITAKVEEGTLDESPLAYKDIFEVMNLQKDLVEVVERVIPIINIKG